MVRGARGAAGAAGAERERHPHGRLHRRLRLHDQVRCVVCVFFCFLGGLIWRLVWAVRACLPAWLEGYTII